MDVVARGREAVVLDAGPGLVLRRYLDGRDTTAEVALHRHVAEHGYPVPRLVRQEPGGMVLERLTGPTLHDALLAGSVAVTEAAATLARLHRALHALPAPPGSPAGSHVVHLDLHPANVMLTPTGPSVVDWASGGTGDPDVDVAHTALVLAEVAVAGIDAGAGDVADDVVAPELVHELLDAVLLADHGARPTAGLDAAAARRTLHGMPAATIRAAAALVRARAEALAQT